MTRSRMQQTIASRATVSGFGYWSGRDVELEFRPAAPGTGVTFVRSDLGPAARIPARVDHRVDAPRRSNLRFNGANVDMVEHVMAALAGLFIDNCEVWTNEPEMPGCDGSAAAFVEALEAAGVVEQPALASRLKIVETVRIEEGGAWIEARPADDGLLEVEFQLDYPNHPAIGQQMARTVVTPSRFRTEVADARTFLLTSEADQLRSLGLGARVTNKDLLVFDEHGPVDNPLRHANECARHKALDVIGDLALCGRRVVGQVRAHRSGHRLHAELTRRLLHRCARPALQASA